MFSLPFNINVLRYLVPLALGFILGFYLAESVTTKIYTTQQAKLVEKHKAELYEVQQALARTISEQNTLADKLKATSAALAEQTAKDTKNSALESQRAIIKYKEKLVLVPQPCKISSPGLEYIRDNITGK